MATWEQIIADEEFQSLPTSGQQLVRQQWYDATVLPELKATGIDEVNLNNLRNQHITEYDNGQGYISSFASAAGRGAASTFTSAVQGVGALTGSEAIEQAARDMDTAVTENLTVNPSMEKTNFTGNVLGNVAGFLAPGMAGMRIGRALGAGAELVGGTAAEVAAQTAARAASAQLGGRIAANTTMLASGAGSGAQQADRYGIQGPERMGMVLGNAATEMLSENIFGLGSELNTMSRLAGLGGLGANAARRTGGFLADVGENTVEEIAANVGSNLVTSTFAPEGVKTPGILEGNLEAAAGGAIGGAFFGGVNLMRPLPPVAPRPSEAISAGVAQQAAAANDPEAAAAHPGAKFQPTPAPQVPGTDALDPAFDPTIADPLAPAAGALPPPPGFAETTPAEAFPAALPQGLPAAAAVPGAVPEAFPAAETLPAAPAAPAAPVTTVPRNTELFPDTTNFGGKLSEDAALQTYEERDGYGLAQYVNPRTGSTDVYIAAFGDNDFIAYTREYDAAGNPTNRFTSKLERRTEKPGVTRSMMEDLQSVLPEGHEYTEDTSVSTDGLKFIASQLDKGYELLRNEDGSLVTTEVAISGESKVNDLPIPVDKDGKFGPISITSGKQFLAVRPMLVEMLRRFDPSLGDGNVRWENGTVFIDLPVLKKTTGAAPTQGAMPAASPTAAQTPPTVGEPVVAGRFTGVTEAPPTELFHSGELPEGLDSIDPMRTTGAKQGKRGRDFGGFYAGPAETAAKYKGPKNRLAIAPGARAMRVAARGAIERLSLKDRQDLLDQGVDIISGIDIRGLPESVILNKDVILSVELDTQTAPAATPVTAPAGAVPPMTEQAPPVTPQTPAVPPITPAVASQGATPNDLIDQTGRLTVEGAQSMIEAIQSLGLTTAPFVINNTGVAPGVIAPPVAGSTTPVDGKPAIFLNQRRMTLDTPLHETTHLLTPTLFTEQRALYDVGAALLADSPLRQAIVNRYVTEAGMTMSPEQITEEAMVTGLANNGAEWLRAYAGNAKMTRAIKEFLAKVREWFDDLMYSKGFDPNMSLEQFYKKVNRQILAGKLQQRATNAPVQAMALAGRMAEMSEPQKNFLKTAEAMIAAGKTSEEVRAVTGWFPGKYDGKMRFEVPDDKVKSLTPPTERSRYRLAEVMDHKALFKVYPELKDLQVKTDPSMKTNEASFSFVTFGRDSYVTLRSVMDGVDRTSVLLHEIQHWIQNYEGFALGSSPGERQNLLRARKRYEVSSNYQSDLKEVSDAIKAATKKLEAGIAEKVLGDKLTEKYRRTDELRKEVEALKDRKASIESGLVPWEFANAEYRSAAGEIESRDVQARQGFTPSQRREIPPYSSEDIDPADASVNVGLASGTRFSLAPAAKGGNFEVKYVAADEYDAEEGGVDPYEADTAVAKIAKETGVGILRGKELKAVATNKKGDIVGGLYTEVDGDEFSFDVVVSPASQRQGVGEKLAQEAFSLFQQESDGRDDLAFKVEVTNPGMEVLLGKYGFEVQRRVGQTAIMTHPTNAPRKAKTPSVSADTRFSLAPATPQDKAYVAAVESGDVAAQQKIVDDAAKAAGYNVGPVWHASDSKFDVFDLSKSKDKYPEFWFTGNKNYASNHGKYVRRFYLSDPYYRGEPEVFTSDRPERIKSADPITYDDNGKIILPSQRFDTTSPDIRFSLAPAVTKPSNVARNQAGTRVRVLMENQTYEGQTMDDAIEQALPLYDANVDKGFTVAQHMAFIQELRLNAKGKYQDMTFGAYAGMYTRDLLNESTNPERDPMSQELAKRESDKIGALMGEQLAIPGRQVKAADIFNNIANNPAMTVRHAEQLLPFDGKQNVKNDFDKAATTVREEMEGLGNEAINTAPEDAMTSMLGQRVAAVVRGEETSNVGEVVLDEVKPAETEEDLPAWFREGQELLGAELSGKIDDLTELLQVYAYLKRKDGTYSLTPEERSANVAARIKKIEDSGKTLEQALAETKKSIDEILSAFNKPKAKAKPKAAPIPKEAPPEGEIQDIVAARINRLLDKIVKPSTSPAKTRTDKEVLVDAIVSTMMAKAGLPADLKAGGDNVTLAFGLVVANPQLAAQSVQAVYDLLQSDPASANITSSDKIRGFMQMLTGQSFADGKAYGEKQLNTVLKNELKRLKISVNDVAMDAALTGKTVEQLEASLRDPSRELSKVLSPDALNKVVAAVTGEFRKSAAERADGIRSQQAQARVLQDMIDEKNMVIADFKAARAKKEKAAKDAKKKVKEYEDLWTRLKNGEDKAAIRQAERQVRAAQAADMKAEADWVAHQSAESEAISMEAQRSSRDLMEQQNKLNATDRKFRLAINRKNRKAMRRKLAKRGGFMIPLDQSEAEELLDQKPKTVLQYLAREYGFSLADIIGMARDQDRQTTLEAKVGNLAQALGLTKEQADKFMGPVIAEAMKYISEARKKDVSQRINRVLTPVIGKKKTQKTEAEKLIKLAEMGGLTADNVEKLLLNSKNAKEFTPEFRQELIDLIAQANDPHLTEETRDSLKGKFLDKIKAARGITVLSLLGEWTMSNIFMSILSTFKVNFVWGFIKAASDSGIFITISGPAAARADAIAKGVTPAPRLAVAKVLFRQWLRGYAVNMQHNAAFMWSEGLGKDESDMTSQFANTGMEILSRVKDAQIQWSNEGKVLPKSAQKVIKAMAAFGKYTRRTMVASDFINRTSAFEMSKVLEAVKVMQARGGAASTATIQREIDDALYGGNFKDAFAKANKQADDEIAEKKLGKAERGIRVGRIMDEMLGKNLGLTEKQTQEYLQGGRENAKRWSLADTTEGIFGEISNLMLAATRKIPALKFALPAIRMPIAAFSQTLDWTPYGFLRLYAIDKNSNETQSFTNYLFNRNGEYGNWNKPVGGVPAYRKTDLMAKATIGSMIMIGLCIKAALSFDEDEDEADFYITGLGPSDPAENKAWREKGNAPFTFRFNGGTGFRFQESPFYGMLAPIAAWSDAHRYGKPGEAESDRIAYAMGKTLAGFQEAVVMKNLSDILAGGSSYSADGQLRNWSKATSRLASNVLMPRLGGEINTILYGPQDQKALGWGGRALANVPFVPSFNNKPAQDFLGREIHTKREGMLGEIYPALAHRVIAPSLDDPILNFVAKMSPNFLATTRRFKDGTRVMDNYEFVRKWNAAAGVKIREYLTPERMASYERKLAKDKPDAQTEFNVEINKIRTAALRKFSEVQF